jgi:hypothetical protein
MSLFVKFKRFLRKIGLHKTATWGFLKICISDIYFSQTLHQLGLKGNSNDQLKVLVINHFFDGEIEALLSQINNESISLKYIYPEPTFTRAFVWFSSDLQNAYIPYDSEEVASVRIRFNEFCEKAFWKLQKKYKFDCIVTPSDSFFWIREFILVAEKYGVLTIVADKEGVISPYDYLTAPPRIREFYPALAKCFFVWSERQKSFWMKSGVPIDNIKVIGSIRTDNFIHLPVCTEKKSVLYFDFDIDAYINIFDWNLLRYTGSRSWGELRDSFHKVIYKVAIKNPELIFYLKCHPQQIVSNFPDELINLDNVKIIKGAPKGIPILMSQSIVVLGFQTTALLEASLSGIPVVYGAWGKLYDAVNSYLLPWHESGFGFSWARSEDELEELVLSYINNQKVNVEDKSRLNEYFYDSNGYVAARFLKEVKIRLEL